MAKTLTIQGLRDQYIEGLRKIFHDLEKREDTLLKELEEVRALKEQAQQELAPHVKKPEPESTLETEGD
ncbi:hypothetical protein D9M71_746310 [compost metagenome]